MSDAALPEDPARWPEDPFELLGVSRSVSPRDLRRAYTRLIRTWKPEQFPAQFRRIREAYETAQRYVELYARYAEEDASPEPTSFPEAAEDDSPSPMNQEWTAPRPSPEEERDPWDVVLEGREAEAYRLLVEDNQRHPGWQDTYLRLYWLLALNTALDPGRVPNDWLAEGLRATGWAGSLRELYRQALTEDPAEALSERCCRLVADQVAVPRLVELIDWRWEALARLRSWDVVQADFAPLRERLIREDESAWVRLVLGLMVRLAWSTDAGAKQLWQVCTRELKTHSHLALSLSDELDRLELVQNTATAWQALHEGGEVPPPFLKLISTSWGRPWGEVRGQLLAFLHELRQRPSWWLDQFETIRKRGPAVLARFGELLDELQGHAEYYPSRPRDGEALAELVCDFLDGLGDLVYTRRRAELLDFCLREGIAPEEVAEVVKDRPRYRPADGLPLSEFILQDWPLRYVCKACWLFWA